ncbi:MAG: sigma-54-dependent Fis family transcriptional regulator [Firmicutes bacterium]|nr:sigma-54-dependent Fis family transcriptional regulator [Bacillota bacterium]
MNILLVKENCSNRSYLGKLLREKGFCVAECGSGREALETFSAGKFDMVLSDVKMPKMDGIHLLHELSALTRNLDMVLFTGHSELKIALEALQAGASDYLLKPFNITELLAVIERVSKRRADIQKDKDKSKKSKRGAGGVAGQPKSRSNHWEIADSWNGVTGKVYAISNVMKDIFAKAEKLHTDRSIPVLIQGETGTGKELVAKHIHHGSGIDPAPFIDINCAALNSTIFESELFGYEPGAFTGGLPKGQKGKLDMARGGTIFLDEISELSVGLQAKLLRFIQEKEFYRVGGLKKIKADVRIICATNEDIEKKVWEGAFRKDLFYRINLGRILIPPLKERTTEILPLAEAFLKEISAQRGKSFERITDPAAKIMLSYNWPGNVRELRNTIEWVVFMYNDTKVEPGYLDKMHFLKQSPGSPLKTGDSLYVDLNTLHLPEGSLDLESLFNRIIIEALNKHRGNKAQTARYLGISRHSLYTRLEKIKRQKK